MFEADPERNRRGRLNITIPPKKGSALVWKYDDVDPEFASMQVKELHQHLQGVLSNARVEVTVVQKEEIAAKRTQIEKMKALSVELVHCENWDEMKFVMKTRCLSV